ncbi:C6 transcription factor [Aspergillus bombycis]|uniref:C6 transcription factor n=1 Tax=Aspergillus bombycis TaxID=109264 RepID=A0A1F7ZWL6_9EURO|nr:C6 transcription factor [Aspergillus bombycis]OGM43834.1 C6 transcription factor [Aspergillus bombycis]
MPRSHPNKRQRISRACDQCRRRKSKCDGEQPECAICRQAGRRCTYQDNGRRRGLQTGYVKALETVLGIVFQQIPDSESAVQSFLRDPQHHGGFFATEFAEKCTTTWRNSKVAKGVGRLLAPESQDEIYDPLGDDDDDHQWESCDTHSPERATLTPMNVPNADTDPILPSPPPQPATSDDILSLPFPDDVAELVDFYFVHIQCWFPILDRREILRTMHGDTSSKNHDAGYPLVLWAIIAYVQLMREGASLEACSELKHIETSIRVRLMLDFNNLELSHVQTLLIVALLNVGRGNLNQAWVLIGQAMRVAVTLPETARKPRYTHVFQGCVFLDNMVSALLERTPCLSLEEQSESQPVAEDDLEEWETWTAPGQASSQKTTQKGPLRALSMFNLAHQLMQLLTQVLYCPPRQEAIQQTVAKLRDWQAILSTRCPYPARHSPNPPLLNLHLTSAFVTLCLVSKCHFDDVAITEMALHGLRTCLDLLDHYIEITSETKSSPLLYWFFFQAQRCLRTSCLISGCGEEDVLQKRCGQLMGKLKLASPTRFNRSYTGHTRPGWNVEDMGHLFPGMHTLNHAFTSHIPANMTGHATAPIINTTSIRDPPSYPISGLSDTPELTVAPTIPTPISPIRRQTPHLLDETGNFDALFEEMIASITPMSHEPTFAHNLGFHAGNLVTDFVAELQQPTHD